MSKVYAVFGIEIFDESIANIGFERMSVLGEIKKFKTKRNSLIINYSTCPQDVDELETVSDFICNVIEPYAKKISSFLLENKDKLYADICFVKLSDDDNIVLKINKRLLSLATLLDIELNFDGF